MNLESLALELERNGVAGHIVTPVHDVYRKVRMLVEGDPDATFGLAHLLPASPDEVLDGLKRLAGAEFPPEGRAGGDVCWVDPSATAAQAESAAQRLRQACEREERVLFGTGHPTGPLEMYARLAAAMAERGAEVTRYAEAEWFSSAEGRGRAQVRYVCGVACVSGGGNLYHTHSPRPMEYLLDTGPRPDLVVGDHGFVGAGLARGSEAVALVDTNDPALVLAWLRGLRIWPLLCDDNRPPSSYGGLCDYLLAQLP